MTILPGEHCASSWLGMLDAKGQAAEADRLREQLEDDVAAVAARLSKPEFLPRRRMLATQVIGQQLTRADQSRPAGCDDQRTASH